MFSIPEGILTVPEGLLPKWLLFISVVSMFNTVQNFAGTSLTRRIYAKRPSEVTALTSHLFGVWTLLSAVIRYQAAWDISNPTLYRLAQTTFGIALFHFCSELFVFKSARLNGPFFSPLVVASVSLTWMYMQKSYYL